MTQISRRAVIAAPALILTTSSLPSYAQGMPMQAHQAPGFYRYKIGDMIVTGINDGFGKRPVDGFIKNAELNDVKKALESQFLSPDTLNISYTTLVFQTSEGVVLLDTGNGDSGPPTSGTWMANFKAAGFDPKDVKKIILSHFHGDHINGMRLKDGTLVFPNAEVSVPAAEWAFWMSDENMNKVPEASRGGFMNVRRVLAPLAKDIKQYNPGAEVAKGVMAVAAYGHTPGHNVFAIQSGNAKLIAMSDTTNHPALFVTKPDWSAIFDMDADVARATRRKLLDMAASERAQLAFYHAPFPATGYVSRNGADYLWVPAAWGTQL